MKKYVKYMAYRKVGYHEQCWYIIKWKIKEIFRRKEKKHE